MSAGEARSPKSGRGQAATHVRLDVSRSVLIPAHADVAVLELELEFHTATRRSVGRPRLIVSAGDESVQARALGAETAHAGPDPSPWRASFAVPRSIAEADDATFALAIGRSLVLDLARPVDGRPPERPPAPSPHPPEAQPQVEAERNTHPPVSWLEEVEAETAATADDSSGPTDDEDDGDDVPPGEALASRRMSPPSTFEHDAVYDATLRRMQVERRARMRRRRSLGRLLALVGFLVAAAALYIVVTGAVGVDVLQVF